MKAHKHTFAVLLVAMYIATMLFFATVRACGLLWFDLSVHHEAQSDLPLWAGCAIMYFFWVFDGVLTLRTLSNISWKRAILVLAIVRSVFFLEALYRYSIIPELALVLLLPLFNTDIDKETTLGYAIFYFLGVSAYQIMMMFGRGYPYIQRFSPSWQVLSMIDYHLFIFGIYIAKGAIRMVPGPGCWFFWGKFDKAAKAVGHFLLKPFLRSA